VAEHARLALQRQASVLRKDDIEHAMQPGDIPGMAVRTSKLNNGPRHLTYLPTHEKLNAFLKGAFTSTGMLRNQ